MAFIGFRRDVVYAMTGLLAVVCSESAQSAQLHVLQPGETIAAVARKFHTTVKEIVRANHLANPDCVPDFAKLKIPVPRANVAAAPAFYRPSVIKGNHVSIRLNPDEASHRMDLLNSGTHVTVDAFRKGWSHVDLPSGRSGWIRSDFLQASSRSNAANRLRGVVSERHHAAAHKTLAKHSIKIQHAAHIAALEHQRRARLKAAHLANAERAKHARLRLAMHEAHTHAVARHSQRHHSSQLAFASGSTDIVRTAFAYRGTPYRYGGSGRGGFDCSGFTSYLYARQGISLPHSARAQFQHGRYVGRDNLRPGDLVFFHTVTPGISHVGMYVGNGKFVHASSRRSGGVRVDSLSSGYYRERLVGARHIR